MKLELPDIPAEERTPLVESLLALLRILRQLIALSELVVALVDKAKPSASIEEFVLLRLRNWLDQKDEAEQGSQSPPATVSPCQGGQEPGCAQAEPVESRAAPTVA